MKAIHALGASLILAFGSVASLPALAEASVDAKAVANKNGCAGCHAADKKMVGPSWRDIAARYKGGDQAALIASVRAGGKGTWGNVAMPAQPRISDADLKAVLAWAMSQ